MNNVENFVNGVGAVAEALGMFYKQLIASGMSEACATELCKAFMESVIPKQIGGKK